MDKIFYITYTTKKNALDVVPKQIISSVADPDPLIPDPDPAFWLTNLVPDPDPGFDDQKFKK